MTLMQLKCFYYAAIFKSITRAAEEIYLSQPSVSKYILQLERELDLRLLVRNNKELELTSEGKLIFKHCEEIFSRINLINQDAEKLRKTIKNNKIIRLCGVPTMKRYGLTDIINKFLHQNPEYDIVIEEMHEDRVIFSLQAEYCDIIFCSNLSSVEQEFPGIRIAKEGFSAIIAKEFVDFDEKKFSLSALKDYPMILDRPESMLFEHCRAACRNAGFEPNLKMLTTRPENAVEFLLEGKSCYLSLSAVLEHVSSDKHIIFPADEIPDLDFCLFWNDKSKNEMLKQFLKFVKQELRTRKRQS